MAVARGVVEGTEQRAEVRSARHRPEATRSAVGVGSRGPASRFRCGESGRFRNGAGPGAEGKGTIGRETMGVPNRASGVPRARSRRAHRGVFL